MKFTLLHLLVLTALVGILCIVPSFGHWISRCVIKCVVDDAVMDWLLGALGIVFIVCVPVGLHDLTVVIVNFLKGD